MSEQHPPHIVIHRPGGARDEIRFEPPDIWKVKHIGPKQELPGCNFPCTNRWTSYHEFTTEEIAARYSKETP